MHLRTFLPKFVISILHEWRTVIDSKCKHTYNWFHILLYSYLIAPHSIVKCNLYRPLLVTFIDCKNDLGFFPYNCYFFTPRDAYWENYWDLPIIYYNILIQLFVGGSQFFRGLIKIYWDLNYGEFIDVIFIAHNDTNMVTKTQWSLFPTNFHLNQITTTGFKFFHPRPFINSFYGFCS